MKKYTHLILHGSYGSDTGNWTPWLNHTLEAEGHSVLAPQFPVDDWELAQEQGKNFVPTKQTLSNWLRTFEEILPLLDTTSLTVYAHSSAPLFILHVLSKYPEFVIKEAYFVAPFLGKIGDNWPIEKVNESFYAPESFNYEVLSNQIKNSVVLYSNNDPYVAENYSIEFAKKINATLILVPNAGHFNTEAGITKLPEVL